MFLRFSFSGFILFLLNGLESNGLGGESGEGNEAKCQSLESNPGTAELPYMNHSLYQKLRPGLFRHFNPEMLHICTYYVYMIAISISALALPLTFL